MVLKGKGNLVIILLALIMLLQFGCSGQTPGGEVVTETDTSEDTVSSLDEADEADIKIPQGKIDRLPGSLRWETVEFYAQGFDFYKDQPGGLSSGALAESSVDEEPAQTAETTESTDTSTTTGGENQTTAGDTASENDTGLPQDGDVFITTVDDTVDWDVPLDQPADDDGDNKWYELD